MAVRGGVVWLGVALVACGSRTHFSDQFLVDRRHDDAGMGGDENGAGGAVGTGGVNNLAGGRPNKPGRGTGGRGAGGVVAGSGGLARGGSVSRGSGGVVGAGGMVVPPPEAERLRPFMCRNYCSGNDDCPSPAPYAGGCNGIFGTCLITCEKGCPADNVSVSVAGGCFCYEPHVSGIPETGTCCSTFCGPPYYLPCCNGFMCMPDGNCCPPGGCF